MTAPMIDVQGHLLLPTLYPLANQAVSFGREWASTHARPVFSEYEVPFYAAKLLTAYVSALSIREATFPYAPANLWHKLSRTDFEAFLPRAAAASFATAAPASFEPFTADARRRSAIPPAKRPGNRKLAGGAIALAGVGLLAWLMFGTEHGPKVDESTRTQPMQAATPVVPASAAQAVARAYPAATEPVVAKVTNSVAQRAPDSVSVLPKTTQATVRATAGAVVAPVVSQQATRTGSAKTGVVSQRSKSNADEVYPAPSRKAAKAVRTSRRAGIEQLRGQRRSAATSARNAAYDRLVAVRDADANTQGAYRQPAQSATRQTEAPVARSAARPQMSVAEMYNMLQHSPTLDDNSSLARSASRSHASAGEAANANVQLSKQRVTDAPGDFTK
jgi:hypothetical protein